ncbi:MAG TPA: redoxin domain-containing protein [Tepidisphaeraceae bacterium]|jgi:thiol-disulfide isomerase/thioredoxin|nr:redoxin domain-containing protein [Tepidisphaeraceae bacterium]
MQRNTLLAAILLALISTTRADEPATTQPIQAIVTVRILGSGEPVAGAKVSWSGDENLKGSGQTTADGQCAIANISSQSRWMSVKVSYDELTPMVIFWSRKPNDPAEASLPKFEFQLEKGNTIGGQVVDDSGKPIAAANVIVAIRKQYAGSKQEPDLSWKKVKADANGHWALKGVPGDPEEMHICAYDVMHLANEFYYPEEYKSRTEFFDQTSRLTLPVATPIEISVLKPDGSPAVGAKVFLGRDNHVSNCIAPAKVDAQGQTHFGCKVGMSSVLTASLAGFGPAQQAFSVKDNEPVHITLNLTPAIERTIEAVDSSGKPVRDATIDVSDWRGSKVLSANLHTDDNGHAVWKDGPADEVTASAYAEGYMGKSDFSWSAEKSTRVVLVRPTIVTGRVVDAESGEQINNFKIRASVVWREGERSVWQTFNWGVTEQAKKEPGKFVLPLDDPAYRYLLRVMADGYLPEDTPSFEPDGNARTFEFKLKRGNSITGKVMTAEGKPLAGAEVYVADEGDWVGMVNGSIRDGSENNCDHVKSGLDGGFVLPPQKENFALLVLSDYGAASIRRDQMANKETILTLSPWAKVRGIVKIGGKPAAKVDLSGNADPITLGDDTPLVSEQYAIKTDNDGHFELPRVMPGRFMLKRQIDNHSPGRMWYVCFETLDAKPGESYDQPFGAGASVAGQLQIPAGKQWMIRQARINPKGQPPAEDFDDVEVLPDGHFRAEGLKPGDYSLHIALHEFPPNNDCGWGRVVGEYNKDFTISSTGGQSDLGTLTAEPITGPDLKVGDTAPDFSVKTLDGKSIHLADLKGKVVLVDFWAGWCAPCVVEIPNMQKIADANHDNSKFAIVSLSLDEKEKDLQGIVNRDKQIDWPQAWVGVDSDPVKAYGATAIPATFLIGKDGLIIARDLRGEELKKAVDSQLAK